MCANCLFSINSQRDSSRSSHSSVYVLTKPIKSRNHVQNETTSPSSSSLESTIVINTSSSFFEEIEEAEEVDECQPSKAKKKKIEEETDERVATSPKCRLRLNRLPINDRSGTFRIDGLKYTRIETTTTVATKQAAITQTARSSAKITKYQDKKKESVQLVEENNSKNIFNNTNNKV